MDVLPLWVNDSPAGGGTSVSLKGTCAGDGLVESGAGTGDGLGNDCQSSGWSKNSLENLRLLAGGLRSPAGEGTVSAGISSCV